MQYSQVRMSNNLLGVSAQGASRATSSARLITPALEAPIMCANGFQR